MSPSNPHSHDDIFSRSWSVYQKFVTHNWLRHREVYAALRDAVRRDERASLAVADFGCGDAACTIEALAGSPLQRFVAVDRVRPLLDSAAARLAGRCESVDLIESDVVQAAASPPAEPVDVLIAAYSVHHLDYEQKREFFGRVRDWVAPGGRFVLIDAARRAHEDRLAYLARFHQFGRERFSSLTCDERAIVCEHMDTYDFPETIGVWRELLTSAGWPSPRLAYRDPDELYAVLTCRRR